MKELKYKIKLLVQRIMNGQDETIYYDPDTYLAGYIQKVANMKLGQEACVGIEYRELQQLSFGMGSYLEMCSGIYMFTDPEYKRLDKEFKRALKLLPKYFCKLWY